MYNTVLTALDNLGIHSHVPFQHAEEDRKRKERIEAVNNAESIIHDTEKNLNDYKDDIEEGAADGVRQKITELRELLGNAESSDAEDIRTKAGEVQQESLKVFEVAYKKVSSVKQLRIGLI